MRWLGARLKAAGFQPELFDYPSVTRSAADARPRLEACLAGSPCHVLAHSLGGVLALGLMRDRPGLGGGRVVCLGSPLCGSGVARDAGTRPLRRFTVGESAAVLDVGCPELPVGVEVGMVAGDRPLGLGQLFGRVEGPHDGTVSLAETRPPGLQDHVIVHASHSSLLLSHDAARQAVHFLEEGRFLHAA